MTTAPTGRPVPYALTAKARAALTPGGFPPVVCLCGSTRFHAEFARASLRLTLAGQIVLSIGCDTRSDGDLAAAGELGADVAAVKGVLDELHRRKIDLADYVFVLNVGGYVGASTAAEIAYAAATGTPVAYLEPAPAETWSWACAPGGNVCAWPDPGAPDGICGMPAESEPCPGHADVRWACRACGSAFFGMPPRRCPDCGITSPAGAA